MEQEELKVRVERCRRLARQMTDAHMRLSLEALADEYEAQLPLDGNDDGDDDDGTPGFVLRTRH